MKNKFFLCVSVLCALTLICIIVALLTTDSPQVFTINKTMIVVVSAFGALAAIGFAFVFWLLIKIDSDETQDKW